MEHHDRNEQQPRREHHRGGGAHQLADVIVGDHFRIDPWLDKEFIANIKERGVIVPIVAHYEDQGRGVVVDGQRRTLAAVQAGRDIIPAYVSAAP